MARDYDKLRKGHSRGKIEQDDYLDSVLPQDTKKPKKEAPQAKPKPSKEDKEVSKPAPPPTPPTPPPEKAEPTVISPVDPDATTRATFIVKEEQLDRLKDLVFTLKYKKGKVVYDQKTAVKEAFELLFKRYPDIEARPPEVREEEEKRKGRKNY